MKCQVMNCKLCVDVNVQLETQSWFFDNTDKFTCEQKVYAVGQVGTAIIAVSYTHLTLPTKRIV